MMGLLDMFDDPKQMGLLSLGLRLMSTPGKFGPALGTAGMGAIGDMQQVKQALERKQQNELERKAAEQRQAMQALQMQQIQQQMDLQKVRAGAAKNAFVPGVPGMVDTAPGSDGLNMPDVAPRFDMQQYMQELARGGDAETAMDVYARMQKDSPTQILPPGAIMLRDGKTIATNPVATKEEPKTQLARMIAELNALPPNDPRRQIYMDAIRKDTTHAPGATAISYGSPVPFALPGGGTGYVQPGNRAGAPPEVMTNPATGQPFTKPTEAKEPKNLTEDQGKATSWLERMNQAEKVILNAPTKALTSIGSPSGIAAAAIDTIPIVGGSNIGKAAQNAVMSKDRQSVITAQEAWVAGLLRSDTGAAYKDMEKADIVRTFFPQPFDGPTQITLKKQLRDGVKRAMQVRAGPGVDRLDKVPSGSDGKPRFLGYE